MLGFGIIGCGMISAFHARAIADVRGAKLIGGFDNVSAAAEKLAANFGCKAYPRLRDMLADPAVDVVSIGTPSGAHLDPAVAAARAGKHVIVEKPLEITLRRCDKIISECEKAG
ncbi:MAG: Gfo/Idh/MocA family protein, partial [Thermoguttaceae bacterium]